MKAQSKWIKPIVAAAVLLLLIIIPISTGCKTETTNNNETSGLTWGSSIEQALSKAKDEKKLVLLDFWGGS